MMAKKAVKTADGVEVTAGDLVWLARDGVPTRQVKERPGGSPWVPARGKQEDIPFFGTRGAAIAARLREQKINLAAIRKEIRWLETEVEAEASKKLTGKRTRSRRKVGVRKRN